MLKSNWSEMSIIFWQQHFGPECFSRRRLRHQARAKIRQTFVKQILGYKRTDVLAQETMYAFLQNLKLIKFE